MANIMNGHPRSTPVRVTMPPFGISALTSHHAPTFHMPYMRHPFDKICLIEKGQGEVLREGVVCPLGPGVLVRVPPNDLHRFADHRGTPMTLSVLCIGDQAMQQPTSVGRLWAELLNTWPAYHRLEVANPYHFGEYRRLFRAIIFELGHDRPARDAVVFALAIHMLTLVWRDLQRNTPRPTPQLSEAFLASIAYLDDHFPETIRVEHLAEQAGMSYRAYTDRFRQYKGMTVTQYVNHRRIEFAKRRLLERGDILSSALEAGFGDLSHFYRIFRRLVGDTPQAFLTTHRPDY